MAKICVLERTDSFKFKHRRNLLEAALLLHSEATSPSKIFKNEKIQGRVANIYREGTCHTVLPSICHRTEIMLKSHFVERLFKYLQTKYSDSSCGSLQSQSLIKVI